MIKLKSTFFFMVLFLGASTITVLSQFNYIYENFGEDYIKTTDFNRHQKKINGNADAPYSYRLLTDYILEYTLLKFVPYNTPEEQRIKYEVVSFGFRFIQNFVIFFLAFIYLGTLGISRSNRVMGILILISGMNFAFNQSDLSFYTYTELAFFLFAGILINFNKDWWILPLTILATLNREGAVFIPVMLFSARFSQTRWRQLSGFKMFSSQLIKILALSMLGFFVIYFGARFLIRVEAYSGSRYGAVFPGFQLLYLNIFNLMTWVGLAQMFSLLPLTIIFVNHWPTILKMYLLFLVLPWSAAVFVFGSADETRLFLVPLAIVFIPALLKLVSLDNLQSS